MLADTIDPDCIFFEIEIEGKEGDEVKQHVLQTMTEKLCANNGLAPTGEILDALLERERERSTGIEYGLAVPHCRTNAVDRIYIAMAILRDGIDWGSVDEKPTQFVFLVVGPTTRPEEYLKLLSQISRLMKSDSTREKLSNAKTAEEVIEILRED